MRRPEKKLRAWRFAGLLTTYRCSARCAFCYVFGAPEQGGSMSPERAVAWWRQLDRVANLDGRSIRIHVSGGEPFVEWDNLVAILEAAARADLPPPQKVETNADWATDDGLTRDRLIALRSLRVRRLDVSADVFHQAFVDVKRVRRCVRVAREVFGDEGVRVRWGAFLDRPVVVRGMTPDERDRRFADALLAAPERMTGRAAFVLAPMLPSHPPEHFAGRHCVKELLKSKHVHVGPEGYVFPGVCSGVLLGDASREPLDDMWHRLARAWRDEPILAPLVHEGPLALFEIARRDGYVPLQEGYATKCHLCAHVRQFFFERGTYPTHLGPAACYADRTVLPK